MSADNDFFEDEEDLAREQADATRKAAPRASAAKPSAPAGPARAGDAKPPSFGVVVVIALVAIVLGIGIGYFIAMAVVDRTSGGSAQQATAAAGVQTTAAPAAVTSGEMPEGHPDLSTMINEDGSINEEAVAQYRAQRAAQQEGRGDADGEVSRPSSDEAPMADVDDGLIASGEMPEGHPDLSTMINEDGSINEEAVAQYRAQRAAQQEGQGDGE